MFSQSVTVAVVAREYVAVGLPLDRVGTTVVVSGATNSKMDAMAHAKPDHL